MAPSHTGLGRVKPSWAVNCCKARGRKWEAQFSHGAGFGPRTPTQLRNVYLSAKYYLACTTVTLLNKCTLPGLANEIILVLSSFYNSLAHTVYTGYECGGQKESTCLPYRRQAFEPYLCKKQKDVLLKIQIVFPVPELKDTQNNLKIVPNHDK